MSMLEVSLVVLNWCFCHTQEVPKAMLHVGNKPLLSYPLNMLAGAGFSEAIVVCLKFTFCG